jgi:hypothetical protein
VAELDAHGAIEDERVDRQYRKGFCTLFWNYDDNSNALPFPAR